MASVSRIVSAGLRRQFCRQSAVLLQARPELQLQTIRCETTDAGSALETRPTVRKFDPVVRQNLTEFGQYVAECMPKFVQKVQLTAGDELEILISPSGVIPVMSFLKNHHNCQFGCMVDIAGVDVPTREYRQVFRVVKNPFKLKRYIFLDLKLYTIYCH